MQFKKITLKNREYLKAILIREGIIKKRKKGLATIIVTTDSEPLEVKERVVVSPVFKTKEQEQFFAECAAKSMSINSYLKW